MAKLDIAILQKAYAGRPVLHDVSLIVEAGTLVAILGGSGSGKTTLLRLIAGFERVDGGEIRIDGALVAAATLHKPAERRGIGYMAQEGALFPHLCVADNITFGLPRAARRCRDRVAEMLEMVELPADYAGRAPHQLSGGEQQRVALARALAPNPKLVLLDEPFSALDAGLRADTRETVAAALRAAGTTAILVTHDQEEALSMGVQVGVLRDGQLVQLAAPAALYRRPADAALARFVGEAVLTRGVAESDAVQCAFGRLSLPPGGPTGSVNIMVRPEQIKLTAAPASGDVAAVVKAVTFYGHDATVRLALKNSAEEVTARIFSHVAPQSGAEVWLRIEGEVMVYPAPRPSTDAAV